MPTYTGTTSAETINGSAGDDIIDGRMGDDILNGLGGDDRFLFNIGARFASDSDGSDVIDGGSGTDRFEALGADFAAMTTGAGGLVMPMRLSIAGGVGGAVLFSMTNQVFDPGPTTPITRTVSLRDVEILSLTLTDSPPRPPASIGGQNFTYTTTDTVTIGDLSGTAVTRVEVNLGHGIDHLIAYLANTVIVAHGGAGDDSLQGGSVDDQLFGDDGDDYLNGGAGSNLISGGAGVDTLDYRGDTYGVAAPQRVVVNLNGGVATNGFGGTDTISGVENVIGDRFDDILIGSAGANVLRGEGGSDYLIGLDGNDTLDGGLGADSLQGGPGDDVYIVDSVGDTVIEFAGEGYDTVETSLTAYTLRDNVEAVRYFGTSVFTGRGNAAGNLIAGNTANDVIEGLAGDDSLYGFDGNDILRGGAGNDILDGGVGTADTADYSQAASGVFVTLDQATPQALNDGDGGVDALIGIEYLTGSAFNDILIGDGALNILVGGAGNDILIGLGGNDVLVGGAGANQLQGGVGDDRYQVTSALDTLVENAGEGDDFVETTLSSYTLRANLERLGFYGVGAFAGTGNELANSIGGGAGDDVLSGLGGDDNLGGGGGNDVLIGGDGNDRLVGDAGDDRLIGGLGDDRFEGGVGGSDTIDFSAVTAALTIRLGQSFSDGQGGTDTAIDIENITGGSGNDLLIGDAGANILNGGEGADTLLGFGGNDTLIGGAGAANTMQGGLGDDTYVVQALGDTVYEEAGQGVDTVLTALAGHTLRNNVENLTYTGTGAFTGVGNALANIIEGAGGDDILTGGGGADQLIGRAGVDTVVMSGVRADYTITGDGALAFITDNVAGRDGIDTLYQIERIRFADGFVLELTTPAATPALDSLLKAGAPGGLDGGHGETPLVLPGVDDWSFQ